MSRRPRSRGGFTIIEVLIALGIMAVGLVGILALNRGAAVASSYSRRASEAAILGEDKLEELRTLPITAVADDQDQVDASGAPVSTGGFVRVWTIEWADGMGTLSVAVTWDDSQGAHTITYRTLRGE